MNIFKDNNDWNEKSIVGFVAFLIMVIVMIIDLVTGALGYDLVINKFVFVSDVLKVAKDFVGVNSCVEFFMTELVR